MRLMTGFECVKIGNTNVDNLDTTRHTERYKEDLDLVKEMNVDLLRAGVPWHKIERVQGIYDWEWMDNYVAYAKEIGIELVLDTLHHVSLPHEWLPLGFLDEKFVPSFVNFFLSVLERYPHINKYTIVNEPLVTTHFAFEEGIWFPYKKEGFDGALDNVLLVIELLSLRLKQLGKEHWYVDACEYHYGSCASSNRWAEYKNNWRFKSLDKLTRNGAFISVLGLDFYPHCQIEWGEEGRRNNSSPIPFKEIALQYYNRYKLPIALTETNIRGRQEERLEWFETIYKECLELNKEVPVEAFCWYPFIDSTDWDSLVREHNENIDPQGVVWLSKDFTRNKWILFNRIKDIWKKN